MSSSISRQNFNMLLLTIFAASALVLATVGIYGVVSYSIAQRSREISVRMALGAGRANIRKLVLRQGMLLAIVGVSITVCVASGLVRFIASLLFALRLGIQSCFCPCHYYYSARHWSQYGYRARRATRIDPMQALRSE
jgi:ABC-type antimicrobial peptide transport system permease subunit